MSTRNPLKYLASLHLPTRGHLLLPILLWAFLLVWPAPSTASGPLETYTYDRQNRLIGYTSPTTEATYAYDALDRRIAKVVDGVMTSYIYDMSAMDPLAYDDITLEFTDGILTRRSAHSNAVDEPLGFEAYAAQSGVGSGAEHAIFADRQGSVIWVTDPATGAVVAGYEYDAYGQITQTTGTLVQPYGYTGREYDAESGLYHYRARAYDPASGVFLQVDPIEFESGQLGLYHYVGNDPLGWVDPEGLTESLSFSRGTVVQQAENIKNNTPILGGAAGLAGVIARMMLEMTFAEHGINSKEIPVAEGICPKEIIDQFDKMKPHNTKCDKGSAFIGSNLAKLHSMQFEFMVRSMELAMCYEGGKRGDVGHVQRLSSLRTMQKDCVNFIYNAVNGIGKP
jgi:RHS repeat-associated protein